MKRFLLIRHGATLGNLERRYLGDPGEPLCEEGARAIKALRKNGVLPKVSAVYCGPALRCRQTAELLFPGMDCVPCQMAEIDFGVFKGKNAEDLRGDIAYGTWLGSNCTGDIPGGESVTAFKERCCETFLNIAEISGEGITALVIHGGNIMTILERLAQPKQDFYSYHVPNGGYYLCRWENNFLTIERKSP
jgi:alpha-ribazole phosphatase